MQTIMLKALFTGLAVFVGAMLMGAVTPGGLSEVHNYIGIVFSRFV